MNINLKDLLQEKILNEFLSIKDMVRWSASCFSISNIWYGHGTNNPLDESIQLIFSILGLPPHIWNNICDAKLTLQERQLIFQLVSKRINDRIPVVYLTNKTWFCGHELYIDQRVLIPRSPISELINNKFQFNGLKLTFTPKNILDLCTGSGCIAIACAYLFPNAHIDAIDISLDAIHVAEYNIELHGLENRITPIHSNLFEKLYTFPTYDLIIANPPYIDKKELKYLPKEYSYEPQIGLISKDNGLDLINKIILNSFFFLKKKGFLICEVGNQIKYIKKKYHFVKFKWLKIKNGGIGIFKISRNTIKKIRIMKR
ncbi:50S ribosomal protein L3 N(5)-glutamine methyltransferase [Enterobacteriaceae endosymbiont of Plateumaris braccata]|uniref:50S ribosomal protein L3 N(5)-glutamine methyltransferase n=1 Tax=Enterobacteriaceae endosymbiont of Plateumaris braccata TaxID=2675793 RepID=UPI001448E712|nr:50S ribosomal protein L3 N(5)-glutamine methyltransferase [Enterobacteriaceae endosymbiont of Plateumaris braccata]QJC28116.1 50S ribosomal protein L3 N(5)-glutamine methyltransferase [Enterobacteriaceae endosymbiont of Plateumaris braccata]